MSLKDNLKVVKQELSNDEKILEQAFHLEKFFKKHKKKIYGAIAFFVISLTSYQGYQAYESYKLNSANEALLILYKEPTNKEALETLKENNPKLFNLYIYNLAINEEQRKKLDEVIEPDELLQDLIGYHKAVFEASPNDSVYYKNLSLVEKAYILLKKGDKDGAKNLLMMIDKNSPVAPVAKLLMHYTIK